MVLFSKTIVLSDATLVLFNETMPMSDKIMVLFIILILSVKALGTTINGSGGQDHG